MLRITRSLRSRRRAFALALSIPMNDASCLGGLSVDDQVCKFEVVSGDSECSEILIPVPPKDSSDCCPSFFATNIGHSFLESIASKALRLLLSTSCLSTFSSF